MTVTRSTEGSARRERIADVAAMVDRRLRRAGVFLLTLLLTLLTLAPAAHAAEPDRFDLASISLQPAYISPSHLRASSGLHAIAFSPEDRQAPTPAQSVAYNEPTPAPSTIGIAVGDAGTILRSIDGGGSWWPIDSMRVGGNDQSSGSSGAIRRAPDFPGMGNRSPDAPAAKPIPLPFCEFSDVLWTSPRDVVVVGGGYEPVTGISRGVCVISHDAGESFQLADAHELPRLRRVSISARGSLAAIGDASEASGVNRFGSYDGGETWVEDILPGAPNSSPQVAGEVRTITTPHGTVSVNDRCRAPDGSQFAVASHGRIFRLAPGEPQWRAVRGAGRQTGVLFVAASPSQVPWSLVGRESLQENRRITIVLDAAALDDKTLDRCRAAAAMFGVSDVLMPQTSAQRDELLREHRPAVIALDESLMPPIREAWLTQIEDLRTRAFPQIGATITGQWQGPHRVVLTRPLGAQSYPNWQHSAWQRAWNHASVLRSTALLTGPGVLAHDLTYDALMLVAPGYLPKLGVEVATLDDTSGSVRRDVSLSAGLNLTAGQNRGDAEASTASHRRLQITTARMNQTTRLIEQLRSAAGTACTPADVQRLAQQIEHLLAITSVEDRTRVLWQAYTEISHEPQELTAAQDLLLKLLARQALPASIRRWANLMTKSVSLSVEQKLRDPFARLSRHAEAGPVALAFSTDEQQSTTSPDHSQGSGTSNQAISPFQIAPVSYESEAVPAARILVPETKQTVWQSTRGLHALHAPAAGTQIGDSSESPAAPARINWDYHPVVMGARGIEPTTMKSSAGKTTRENDFGRKHEARRAAAYTPPSTLARPLLDGVDDDTCWQQADRWRSPGVMSRCVADEDYLYFAITSDRLSGICLSLDCDGDYFNSVQFELMPDGARRASLNGKSEISVVWYAAISTESGDQGRVMAEIAIARSSLPAPVCRVRASLVGAGDRADWEVMPDPSQWHPSRQSVPGRQY